MYVHAKCFDTKIKKMWQSYIFIVEKMGVFNFQLFSPLLPMAHGTAALSNKTKLRGDKNSTDYFIT